ncbi:MAG: antibiotic biosynthesis monooxygenase family protein [Myxococcota bacterium]
MVVFRNRLRAGDAAAYRATAARMEELARAQPGFRSLKSFAAEDGERVTISEFDSLAAVSAWRAQSEHLEAQRRGRAEFYAEYSLQTCEVARELKFSAK